MTHSPRAQRPGRTRPASLLAAVLVAAALLMISSPPLAAAQGSDAADRPLLAALRAGGLTLYLRHAVTDERQIDTGRRGERTAQRNLSEAGRVQARALGAALDALGVPQTEVLTSEIYRSLDTAELAFGAANVRIIPELIADEYAGSGGEVRGNARGIARRLAEPRPPGSNAILVGHRTPLELATGLELPDIILPEGAMAVFRADPDRDGGYRLLGTLRAEALISAARDRG